MRKLIIVLLAAFCCATPAWAQSQVYVEGEMFADLKRFSTDSSVSTLNGNAIGGGGSIGIIMDDRWSVSLTLDQSASTSRTTAVPIGVLTTIPVDIPFVPFQSQTSNRLFAASVLLGYHAAATGHRVHPGVVGGLSFVHVSRDYETTISPVPLSSARDAIATPALVIRPTELIDNVPAATVGAEAAIELTTHLSAVPEIRALAFSLNNGPSGFAIRPGITLRWTF